MIKEIYVVEYNEKTQDYEIIVGHNAEVCGEMADGTKTWEFDEMQDGGLYVRFRLCDRDMKHYKDLGLIKNCGKTILVRQ